MDLAPCLNQRASASHSWPKLARAIGFSMLDVYGAAVIVLLLVRAWIGESWPPIAFANTVLHYVLLGCVLLVPLRLLGARRRLVLLNLVPAALFTVYYAPQFLPRPPLTVSGEPLTVLSYNVAGGLADVIEGVIRESDADIVLLQDATPGTASLLRAALWDEYPEQEFYWRDWRGWLMLSRLPFSEPVERSIEHGYLRTSVEHEGRRLALYNIHLRSAFRGPARPGIDIDFDKRGSQLEAVLAAAADETDGVLLMGDFNLTEWSEPYQRLSAEYTDAQRARGWGLGLTRDIAGELPVARIDFAFLNPHLQTVEARTWPLSLGSDHRAIMVRFAFKAGSPMF